MNHLSTDKLPVSRRTAISDDFLLSFNFWLQFFHFRCSFCTCISFMFQESSPRISMKTYCPIVILIT